MLSWGPIANDGSPIKAIHIKAAGVDLPLVAAGVNHLRVGTPDNNHVYEFSVAGENNLALGTWTSDSGQSSGKPAGLSVDAPKPGSLVGATTNVTISWSLASAEGPKPVSYDVKRDDGKAICSDVTRTSCVDDTVRFDGTKYSYTVTATNATGGAAHSSSASSPSWTAVGTPDDTWGNWSVAPTGVAGQARLTYTVPPSRGASSRVLVYSGSSQVGTVPSPGPGGGADSGTVSGLDNGDANSLTLKVCNEQRCGNLSGARSVTPFGPLSKPTITSASASGRTITAKGKGNGNGATATLNLYISGKLVDTATGKGSLTVSGSRTMADYSTNYTVRLELNTGTTTPSRSNPADDTDTVKTGPPPPKTVKISAGAASPTAVCQAEFHAALCYSIHLVTNNFTDDYTCYLTGGTLADGVTRKGIDFSGDTNSTVWWVSPHPAPMFVTCGGVTSNGLG
jgi:hypothetical protein